MKDYINNSSDSSSPSNVSGNGQLPGEEEEKPDITGQSTAQPGQPQPQASGTQTPPNRMTLQDPINLVSQANRHTGQGVPPSQSPQLQAQAQETPQGMGALPFQYARPPYMYEQQSLVNYGSNQNGNVALHQSHTGHAAHGGHGGALSGSPNGVGHHGMGSSVPASSFMQSMAGQGVAPAMISGSLPISPVGAITAQLHELNPGHGWLYPHGVGGISPPHSPGENANALAFNANGGYNGYPFVLSAPPVQGPGHKNARLSIGSSNDDEDADLEPRAMIMLKAEPTIKSDNSDSDHGQGPKDQGSPKGPQPRVDTRTARIQSEQRRRNDLRAGFERLRGVLPHTYQRCSKTVLLERAVQHMQALEDQIKNLSERTELLQAQHNTLTATHQNLVNSLGGHRLPHLQANGGHIAHTGTVEYSNGVNGVVNHDTLAALNGGHLNI